MNVTLTRFVPLAYKLNVLEVSGRARVAAARPVVAQVDACGADAGTSVPALVSRGPSGETTLAQPGVTLLLWCVRGRWSCRSW